MNSKTKAFLLTVIIVIGLVLTLAAFFAAWFFTATPKEQKNITWGMSFSQGHAEGIPLDWQAVYLAMLDDMQVRHIRLLTNWDKVEPTEDSYFFDDIDWQLAQAESRGATIIYIVGMKTGRWPECHLPQWANSMSLTKIQQQAQILQYIQQVIQRYKGNSSIIAWQVENEPLLQFGECPWYDKEFLKQEVELVKSLDPSRPVVIADSGEFSWWIDAGMIGDQVASTLYRKAWIGETPTSGSYATYDIKPASYWRKAKIIQWIFGKKVIVGELQAEPWFTKKYSDTPFNEQEKTMTLDQFRENIEYARKTGFDTFYLWGVEWMYWMMQEQHKPEIWNLARQLFQYNTLGSIIE